MHYSFTYFSIKIVENGTRRLAEELRSLFALIEEPGSIPCTQKAAHNFNSSQGIQHHSSGFAGTTYTHDTKIYMQGTHPYTSKIHAKKFKRKI